MNPYTRFVALLILSTTISLAPTQNTQAQEVSGSATVLTSAISPVPSFGSKPAVFFGDLKVRFDRIPGFGRIELYSDMGFLLPKGGDLWLTDIWLRYEPFGENFRVAVDWSTFGQEYANTDGDDVQEAARYLAFEIWGRKQIGAATFTAKVWYSKGIGGRTIEGVFAMPKVSYPLELGPLTLTAAASPFGINFTEGNKGLFFYGEAALTHDRVPVSLSATWVEPLHTEIPFITQFAWGLTYSF